MRFEKLEGSPILPCDIFSNDENLEDTEVHEDKDEGFKVKTIQIIERSEPIFLHCLSHDK